MNELLFFVVTFIDLGFVLLAWKLGKEWVYVTIIANIILVSTFAAKLIPIFGLVTNVCNTFYAAIFIATDILTEHHGKKVGYRSIWMGFIGLVLFILMGQFVLRFECVSDSEKVSNAMKILFSAVPRIAAASFIAYAIAQSLDVWLFDFLHKKTGQNHLWFRNNGSTFVSQLVDSLVFFSLAFVGTVSFGVLMKIIFTGYLVKLLVAVIDTPFIYLSYRVKGLEVPDIGFLWSKQNV